MRSIKLLCPYLKGSHEGIMCGAQNSFIRNIEESTGKLCMSRHYEVCSVYLTKLQALVAGQKGEKICL